MTIRTYIHSSHKRAESSALLDCGAMENFMNMDYAKWLRLPIKRLSAPRPLFNVDSVTLLRALRPDVGGWVTLSPKYWTGVPSDGGRAPYSAVLD